MPTPLSPSVDPAPYRGSQRAPSKGTAPRVIERPIPENSKQPLRVEQIPQTRNPIPTLESTEKAGGTGHVPGDLIYALSETPSNDAVQTTITPVGIR